MNKSYDFCGWATKNNILCSDGRTILPNAFNDDDGKQVPLVWNHRHDGPENIIGHARLENREDGVYAYCSFNNSERGRMSKEIVRHGDISALSIFANKLKQKGRAVVHGAIREVSLVLAGANPEAFIESVLSHSDDGDESAIIFCGYEGDEYISLMHGDEEDCEDNYEDFEEEKEESDSIEHAEKEESEMADEKNQSTNKSEKTVADVFETLTEEQKTAVYAIIGSALESKDSDDDDEGEEEMKHNVFENYYENDDYLSHGEQQAILSLAKRSDVGSFQRALEIYSEENSLSHAESGFLQENISQLYPEYHDVKPGAPELITYDQTWVGKVMNGVHKSPFARIRTGQVDIRNIDNLRAKGYVKGNEKSLSGNYDLVRRTTDAHMVYVKSALHRDDVIDITDFDIVDYQYKIDRLQLDEELATAIMFGDGRDIGSEDKIPEDKIRPIWTDDELYTIHRDVDLEATRTELQGTNTNAYFGANFVEAEALVNTILYALEEYKGSGNLDMYIAPHDLNVMLLARDRNGRRIYSTKAELATVFGVNNIITVEQMNTKTRVDASGNTKKLCCMLVNLSDYSLGCTKGGQVSHFTDFDIDFNQLKSLLETKVSGALTRIKSAVAIERTVTPETPVTPPSGGLEG